MIAVYEVYREVDGEPEVAHRYEAGAISQAKSLAKSGFSGTVWEVRDAEGRPGTDEAPVIYRCVNDRGIRELEDPPAEYAFYVERVKDGDLWEREPVRVSEGWEEREAAVGAARLASTEHPKDTIYVKRDDLHSRVYRCEFTETRLERVRGDAS